MIVVSSAIRTVSAIMNHQLSSSHCILYLCAVTCYTHTSFNSERCSCWMSIWPLQWNMHLAAICFSMSSERVVWKSPRSASTITLLIVAPYLYLTSKPVHHSSLAFLDHTLDRFYLDFVTGWSCCKAVNNHKVSHIRSTLMPQASKHLTNAKSNSHRFLSKVWSAKDR